MKHSNSSSFRSVQRALGERIRQLRKQKGWSQNALASMCRIDPSYISRIEHGETNPRCSVLKAIAEELDVSMFSLLKGIA
ncbi:MAG TPA: helix-turn-helix transcriptional regulator [Candidatus Angelobacter sp.]|jgi:transcriptional regulator with XRE-family HTH domain|nr:helix-turn-helix transcriptional regulator [Candidatus Angelobacter sp.]